MRASFNASYTSSDDGFGAAETGGYGELPIDAAEPARSILPLREKLNPRRSVVGLHVHRRFEQLLFVKRGGGRMMLEDRQLEFRAPSILVVPSLTVHGFAFEPHTERWVVSIAKPYFQDIVARAPELAEIFAAGTCIDYVEQDRDGVELERAVAKLQWEQCRNARCSEIVTEALLIDLLVGVLRKVQHTHATRVAENGSYRDIYGKFVNMVEEHYRENWSLRRFADALRVSVPRLRAICRSVNGESPIRVLNTRILREAKRCLAYTPMSVSEIAYHLGFDDPSYFSRFFKARCDQTPTEYQTAKRGVRRFLEKERPAPEAGV
jgi:AraC family transcriptional activator of pobA